MYRGHQQTPANFILGHEFTGAVSAIGKDVKSFKVGDEITCPFSTTWYAFPFFFPPWTLVLIH